MPLLGGGFATDQTSNGELQPATLTAASASGQSPDLDNMKASGVRLLINITAISGTGASITAKINGKDPVSGTYFTMLASAAITATGFYTLTLFPGATASANSVANDHLPRTWNVSWTIAGTSPSVTGTIGAQTLL